MVAEVLNALQPRTGGSYVDCTVGEGGHSLALLERAPEARLMGIDLDRHALETAGERLKGYDDRVVLVSGNYADLGTLARHHGFEPADGVLFDLGLSSLQVETGGRGFSFSREARLDMRFDPSQATTAYEVVNGSSERALSEIIFRLGEEPAARRIARGIVRNRPIDTTIQLAEVVSRAKGLPVRGRTHPATRTFQAIRMAVNGELENLGRGLDEAIALLRTCGRLVVIAYHSLEDRLVKGLLRREASECICPPGTPECICRHTATVRLINRRPARPTEDEVRANPRSRSARMRVAERI